MNKPLLWIELRLQGIKCEPDEVARILDLCPTAAWRVGDYIEGTLLKRKNSAWVYRFGQQYTFDSEQLLIELLDFIKPYESSIISASQKYQLDVEISFCITMTGSAPALWFSSSTIERMHMINAGLDIDIVLA